jgi:hypothetical protein
VAFSPLFSRSKAFMMMIFGLCLLFFASALSDIPFDMEKKERNVKKRVIIKAPELVTAIDLLINGNVR